MSAAGTTGSMPAQDIGPTLSDWRREADGAKALAEDTGGRVFQTNDLVAGLEKVADESRVTYLLGYAPTNEKRDGRYRKLKVEVRRPGLHVRARAGYFAAKGKEKPAPPSSPVDRALADLFDASDVPLRLAAYVMGPAEKNRTEVLVVGEVRLDALETETSAGRTLSHPKLTLLSSSREGEWHRSEWTLEIALSASPCLDPGPATEPPPGPAPRPPDAMAPGERAAEEVWHPFLTRITMEPGDHRARLVVQSGTRVGSVTHDFIVPPLDKEWLSTPILSDRLVAGGGERRVMPLVRRTFEAPGTLHAYVELHGAALDPASGSPRVTAGFVARSADGREWASSPPTPMVVEAGKPTRLVGIPLADAPEGESDLVLAVRDEVSGRKFEAVEPFRVERRDAVRTE
jgi:hypothetical protein